jgi:hypothetical protein
MKRSTQFSTHLCALIVNNGKPQLTYKKNFLVYQKALGNLHCSRADIVRNCCLKNNSLRIFQKAFQIQFIYSHVISQISLISWRVLGFSQSLLASAGIVPQNEKRKSSATFTKDSTVEHTEI